MSKAPRPSAAVHFTVPCSMGGQREVTHAWLQKQEHLCGYKFSIRNIWFLPVQAPPAPLLFEPYEGYQQLPEGDFVMVLKATQKTVLHLTKQQMTASPLSWFTDIYKKAAQAVAVTLVASRGDLESEAGRHLKVRGRAPGTCCCCAQKRTQGSGAWGGTGDLAPAEQAVTESAFACCLDLPGGLCRTLPIERGCLRRGCSVS